MFKFILIVLILRHTLALTAHNKQDVIKWLQQMQDLKQYEEYMEKFNANGESGQKIYSAEIMDNSWTFTGKKDDSGLPHGLGKISLENGQVTNTISKGKRNLLIRNLKGNFVHGVLEGIAELELGNKSTLFVYLPTRDDKQMIIDGPTVELLIEDQAKKLHITSRIRYHEFTWTLTSLNLAILTGPDFTLSLSMSDPDCKPLLSINKKYYELEDFNWLETFDNAFLTLDSSKLNKKTEIQIEIPNHINLFDIRKVEEKQIFIASLHLLQHRRRNLDQYENFIKNPDLLEEDSDVDSTYAPLIRSILTQRKEFILNSDHGSLELREKCSKLAEDILLWPLEGAIYKAIFPCYPGSGSKWILHLLQEVVGIGAVNSNYMQDLSEVPKSGFLIKTHHRKTMRITKGIKSDTELNYRLWILLLQKRAVLLLRNPYNAMISYMKHIISQDTFNPVDLSHEEMLEIFRKDETRNKFSAFVKSEISKWKQLSLDWINMAPDIYVLHYEELMENTKDEIERILKFIKVPVNKDRLECVLQFPNKSFKRKTRKVKYEQFFNKDLKKIVDSAIKEVDQALLKRNFNKIKFVF